jgi:hypothetical protein
MKSRIVSRCGRHHLAGIVAATVVAFALASCGHDQKTPTAPSTPVTPTTPTPTPLPTLQRVTLTVPTSIAPGESVQARASAVMSDGSIQDVTSLAQWSAGDRRRLDVNSSGIATGVASGEGFVFARYQTRSASATVIVVPAGTYRLRGVVTDEGQPLDQATVTVVGGVGAGAEAVTFPNSGYVLYGVGGHVRLQIKRDGYLNLIQELDVTDHRTVDFAMTIDHPREQVGGRYTLAIGGRCTVGSLQGADLPRTYEATVNQSGARLEVILSGADFLVTGGRGNRVEGTIDGLGRVKLVIGDTSPYYYYSYTGQYDIVERLAGTTVLVANGFVAATSSPSRISGSLSGRINVGSGIGPPFFQFSSQCYSSSHPFEMIRR